MKNRLKASQILNIVILLAVLGLFGICGCGGGSGVDEGGGDGGGGGGGSGTAITEAKAQDVSDGTIKAVLAVVSRLLGIDLAVNESKPMGLSALSKAMPVSKTISVTESSSTCDGGSIAPVYESQSFTIYGSDLATGGSGSCRIDFANEVSDIRMTISSLLDCLEFNGAEATDNVSLDGTISLFVETTSFGDSGITAVANSWTPSLLVGFIQDGSTKVCEIVMNITQSVNVVMDAQSATANSSISGCISVCDAGFDVSGSETQTFTAP